MATVAKQRTLSMPAAQYANGECEGVRLGDLNRTVELAEAIDSVKDLVLSFIHTADLDGSLLSSGNGLQIGTPPRNAILDHHTPHELSSLLSVSVPSTGLDQADLKSTVSSILQYSVNTSSPAFLDKLWSSPSIPGIAADLLLSCLNGNAHVFRVSPAFTLIEKHVGAELARLFGLDGPFAGGVTVPGGAAANSTALLIARNVRFPELKELGVAALPQPLAIFVSEAAHFSAFSAAQIMGLGNRSIRKVTTTAAGTMDPSALRAELEKAVQSGHIPFFVAATAGTTVRGAYDTLVTIGQLAHEYGAWFHVDACWGGAVVFSEKLRYKMAGSELADSIAFNPHKMLGVPQICSFLLAKDLRTFWYANRLAAGYLFHEDTEVAQTGAVHNGNGTLNGTKQTKMISGDSTNSKWRSSIAMLNVPDPREVYDLASFTPQCGRRPDALKLYFHWRYYGSEGMAKHVETAFEAAQYLSRLIADIPFLRHVGGTQVPCTQVCFYYNDGPSLTERDPIEEARWNTHFTRRIAAGLLEKGWMVDYAPGTGRVGELGEFLRIVCNRLTTLNVVEGLVKAIHSVCAEL